MKKGLFITFEGGDGSGKSTQIALLKEYLESQGIETMVTREPGGTQISEQIRKILLDPENKEMDPVTECMLYAAARAQLVSQVIRPAQKEGIFVICDRFIDSSIAYQAYGRELGDTVMDINRHGIRDCMPDITIYLRVDPKIGKQRISGRDQDRIESESDMFHKKVFLGYEELQRSEPDRILTVDAGGTIQEIAHTIREAVIKRIDKNDVGTGKG